MRLSFLTVLFPFPFEETGTETLSHWLKITHLVSDRAESQPSGILTGLSALKLCNTPLGKAMAMATD